MCVCICGGGSRQALACQAPAGDHSAPLSLSAAARSPPPPRPALTQSSTAAELPSHARPPPPAPNPAPNPVPVPVSVPDPPHSGPDAAERPRRSGRAEASSALRHAGFEGGAGMGRAGSGHEEEEEGAVLPQSPSCFMARLGGEDPLGLFPRRSWVFGVALRGGGCFRLGVTALWGERGARPAP